MARFRPRWFVWAAPALLLAAGGGYASWRVLWADARLRDAHAALDHHDYRKAREQCEAYLQVWPGSAEAHLLAARCARHLGAFGAADRHLADAGRLNGDPSPLALEGALLDVQRGEGAASEGEYLRTLVEYDRPETPEIFETLAQSYLFTYRLGEALDTANRWAARRPGDAQAFYLRGLVWEAMQRPDEARDDYRRAVALDAGHAGAGTRLGEVLLSQGDADEALREFDRARRLAPDDPAPELGAARCLRLLGRTEEAFRMLDALAARRPGDAAVWRERGGVATDLDRQAAAEESFRKALAADPFDDQTCYKLAGCLRRLGRPAEADEVQERGRRIEEDVSRLRTLTERVGQQPRDPAPRCEAGAICLRNGQEQEGLRWLLGALQCDPHYRPAHDALADYYDRHGDAKAAALHRRDDR